MTASFQSQEEGFEHQNTMPDVPPPEGLMSETDIARQFSHLIPEKVRESLLAHNPLKCVR